MRITSQLSPLILKVGVFVDEDPLRIRAIMKACRLDLAQLHGDETPQDCQVLSGRVIKAFRAGRDRPSLEWQGRPSAVSSSTPIPRMPTAEPVASSTGNWWQTYRKLGFPLILAGGLNPDNIGAALNRVRPDGIDLSSGVEKSPGVKDPDKIARLMATIKNFADQVNSTNLI